MELLTNLSKSLTRRIGLIGGAAAGTILFILSFRRHARQFQPDGTSLTHPAESLEARNKRRREAKSSAWRNSRRFFKALPLLWKYRHEPLVQGSSWYISPHRRWKMCVFSHYGLSFFTKVLPSMIFKQQKKRTTHPQPRVDPTPTAVTTNGIRDLDDNKDDDDDDDDDTVCLRLPLRSSPWWEGEDDITRALERNAGQIKEDFYRSEAALKNHPNSASLVSAGTWRIIPLWKGGKRCDQNCEVASFTSTFISALPHCLEGGDGIGQAVFSALQPGTVIEPHQGSLNARIRYHLGIEVEEEQPAEEQHSPIHSEEMKEGTSTPPSRLPLALTVGGISKTWKTGKAFVFDDSFVHGVHHHGEKRRVVLLFDVWHPDLKPHERKIVEELSRVLLGA